MTIGTAWTIGSEKFSFCVTPVAYFSTTVFQAFQEFFISQLKTLNWKTLEHTPHWLLMYPLAVIIVLRIETDMFRLFYCGMRVTWWNVTRLKYSCPLSLDNTSWFNPLFNCSAKWPETFQITISPSLTSPTRCAFSHFSIIVLATFFSFLSLLFPVTPVVTLSWEVFDKLF